MTRNIGAVAALLIVVPAVAAAQEAVSFSAELDLSYKQLTVQEAAATVLNEYRPTLWTMAFSPSVAWRGAFLSAVLERSIGESTTADYYGASPTFETRSWRRSENSVAAGYNVWAGLSLFAGYQRNETVSVTPNARKYSYKEEAPYYGVAYQHRFSGGRSLAGSFAWTSGDGTLDELRLGTHLEGEVSGQSFGLTWSAPLAGATFYRLGYRGTRYDFEFDDPFFGRRKTKQAFDALFVGVATYF